MEVKITSNTKFINDETPDSKTFAISELLSDKKYAEKEITRIIENIQIKYPFAVIQLTMKCIMDSGGIFDNRIDISISI